MRKYLIPLSISAFLSWGGLFFLLFKIPPETTLIKIFFLATLFLALFFSLGFGFFVVQVDLFKQREKEAYPSALRRSLFVSLWVFTAGILKLFDAANQFNFLLLLIILSLSEIYLSRR